MAEEEEKVHAGATNKSNLKHPIRKTRLLKLAETRYHRRIPLPPLPNTSKLYSKTWMNWVRSWEPFFECKVRVKPNVAPFFVENHNFRSSSSSSPPSTSYCCCWCYKVTRHVGSNRECMVGSSLSIALQGKVRKKAPSSKMQVQWVRGYKCN